MSMLDRSALAFAIALSVAGSALGADGPKLGQPISPAEAAAWDISIGPDGVGLPPGRGTVAQGEATFAAKCAVCHGDKGVGKPNDVLVGGFDTIASDKPAIKTVGSFWPYPTTFFDYVRRAMPWTAPKSLTDDEVYGLAAYVFRLNGIVGEDAVMDAGSLPKVQMPNRNGFTPFPRTRGID